MNFVCHAKIKKVKIYVDNKMSMVYSIFCCEDKKLIICASGSAVEHLLAKEGVAGSIPVSRSLKKTSKRMSFCFVHLILMICRDVHSIYK